MRLPDSTNRTAIVGATGSGKTYAAIWQLSMRDIDSRAWIVYNWKNDAAIDGIPGAQAIELDEIPIKPGVYITHPLPDEKEPVERQLWEVWARGGIGIYVDEGYMIGDRNPAFRALLTQGRSKEIPVIVLSQRPVWMDRFVFSESEFFQVFRLQHAKDRKAVQEFIPHPIDQRLPPYHSYYYDVARDKVTHWTPVPALDSIYGIFKHKLSRVRKTI